MRVMSKEMRKCVEAEIRVILAESVTNEYVDHIVSCEFEDGQSVMDEIIQNIIETSEWEDTGFYSENDARLSIGRVLMRKMNINV